MKMPLQKTFFKDFFAHFTSVVVDIIYLIVS